MRGLKASECLKIGPASTLFARDAIDSALFPMELAYVLESQALKCATYAFQFPFLVHLSDSGIFQSLKPHVFQRELAFSRPPSHFDGALGRGVDQRIPNLVATVIHKKQVDADTVGNEHSLIARLRLSYVADPGAIADADQSFDMIFCRLVSADSVVSASIGGDVLEQDVITVTVDIKAVISRISGLHIANDQIGATARESDPCHASRNENFLLCE